jgi:hypothetical protein
VQADAIGAPGAVVVGDKVVEGDNVVEGVNEDAGNDVDSGFLPAVALCAAPQAASPIAIMTVAVTLGRDRTETENVMTSSRMT